jgi:arylsulfatase A-like enzyme
MRRIEIGTACILAAGSLQAADKPNVIVILADDLGYHDLGFQGHDVIKTPNIDSLAKSGIFCSDGHVTAPVCSPSRAGLITGRYQQRFGHEGNCPPRGKGMDTSERTLGQAMKALGYQTAIIGKWHLGNTNAMHPNRRGFDEFWGLREGSRKYWYSEKEARNPKNAHRIEHNGGGPIAFKGHLTDYLGDRAVDFIKATKDEPFFLYLCFTAPHGPLQSKPEDMQALGTKSQYYGLIYGLDRNIGKLLKTLDELKLRDNTLIWFLSDNGGIAKDSSNAPLGGQKGLEFEGGQRVPFIVNWPGHLKPGVYKPMVSSLDIYATSVVAAGGSLKQPKPLDGVDLVPYLTGKKDGVPHEQLFWRKLECAGMRDGKWKIVRVDKLGTALYDLDADLSESHNIAAQMPERVEQMQKQLKSWETDKVEPLWSEGEYWAKYRYKKHKERF